MGNYTTRIDKIADKHYRIIINLGKDPKTGTYKKKRRDVHGTKPEAEAVRDEMLYELEQPAKNTRIRTPENFSFTG